MRNVEEKDTFKRHLKTAASQSTFDVSKQIRFVPPFQEKEVDIYFLHFEKIAENLKWPKENWTLLLQSVLTGKARDVYTQLSVRQSSSYETVTEMINNLEIVGKTLIKLMLNLQGLENNYVINGVL